MNIVLMYIYLLELIYFHEVTRKWQEKWQHRVTVFEDFFLTFSFTQWPVSGMLADISILIQVRKS